MSASSTGINENCFDYALFYNDISCVGGLNISSNSTLLSNLNVGGDISCSGLSVFGSINNTTGSILTQLNNLSTNTGLITPNNITIMGVNPTYSIGGGSLIGYCNTVPSTLSTTATIGDSVIRSGTGNRLILQSGSGSYGLYLDSSNNCIFKNNVSINGVLSCNSMNIITSELITGDTTMDSKLFVSGNSIFQNASTCLSSLNVSGLATMNNLNVNTTLNVSGTNILTSISNIQFTKSQFYFNLTNTNTIVLNGITYYKWDINM